MKTLISKTIVLSMFIATAFVSCADSSNQEPVLPPEESMVMDFSDFQSTDAPDAVKSSQQDDTTMYNNWALSATTVVSWNMVAAVNSVIPITAFKEAFKHSAVFMADSSKWVRTFTVSYLGSDYTCDLEATDNDNSIFWKMLVSKSGGTSVNFSNLVLFTGTSSRDGSSATWQLYKDPRSQGSAYLQIVWVKNISLRYTLVDQTDANVGNYIEYSKINEAGFNAQFLIQSVKLNSTFTIQWNRTDKNGRVKCQECFSDLDWHYWDTNFRNKL